MYLYESHMGGIYASNYEMDYEDLYCEQCGDNDWLIGEYETIEEYWNLIKDDCSINGSGGWCLQSIYVDICKEFNLPIPPLNKDYWVNLSDDEIIKNIEKYIKEKK